jgi:hypothetical protein
MPARTATSMIENSSSTVGNCPAKVLVTGVPVCVYCRDCATPFRTVTSTGPLAACTHRHARDMTTEYEVGAALDHRARAIASSLMGDVMPDSQELPSISRNAKAVSRMSKRREGMNTEV